MKWKQPPVIKIYEALGSLGDKRIEFGNDNTAKVYSSSRGKYYAVQYSPEKNAITANDNGSYWKGYLGYPSIAFLLGSGLIGFDVSWAQALSGFAWKDINTKFKNDFLKTEEYINNELQARGYDIIELKKQLKSISDQIETMQLERLPSKLKPPNAY